MRRTITKRTPIKVMPRRQPGISMLRQMVDRELDRPLKAVFGFLTMGAAALVAWVMLAFPSLLLPVVLSIGFCAACIVLAYEVVRAHRRIADLGLGLKGERAVAEALESLASRGYRAFHSLPSHDLKDRRGGPAADIDHVLVGPAGVFVIETKTASKRDRHGGEAQVEYDGERVRIDGFEPDRDPIVQVKACRDEVRRYIEAQVGLRDVPVRGVVVYPGWFVQECSGAEVWVLEPAKRLPAWIRIEEEKLGRSGRRLAADRLAVVAAALDRWARE